MRFELVEKRPYLAGRCFRQKALTTEIGWDGVRPLPPTVFVMFRVSYRTRCWRGPEGQCLTYEELREHATKGGEKFMGTFHYSEAVDFEYWEDWGSDGHIEWEYQGVWRFFLRPETEGYESEWRWLEETSGDEIQRILADHLYEINRDEKSQRRTNNAE